MIYMYVLTYGYVWVHGYYHTSTYPAQHKGPSYCELGPVLWEVWGVLSVSSPI